MRLAALLSLVLVAAAACGSAESVGASHVLPSSHPFTLGLLHAPTAQLDSEWI
jgi:hypothetical protein